MKDVIDPLRPVAKEMEEVGDDALGGLLRQNLDEEGQPSRRWSPWRSIDPVKLADGKVLVGKGEFPAEYGGRCFVFVDEESRNKFLAYPQKYLKTLPQMPKTYNISILGPPGSGVMETAEMLAQRYKWKIVDVEKLLNAKIKEMMKWGEHVPSNPKSGSIHPSQDEYKNFIKGGTILGQDMIGMILHELGVPVYKRPPKPVPIDEEEEERKRQEEEAKAEEERKEKEKAEKKKKRKSKKEIEEEERKKKEEEERQAKIAAGELEEERIPTPPPEDLLLKDVGAEPDEEGNVPTAKGVIFINFPNTEEQVDALIDHGINIDRIIFLADKSEDFEQEAGSALKQKADYTNQYVLDFELEKARTTFEMLGNKYEDIVREVAINYPPEEF